MQVERQRVQQWMPASGARVRNAYAIYLELEDSPEKSGLILHTIGEGHPFPMKAPAVSDEHA